MYHRNVVTARTHRNSQTHTHDAPVVMHFCPFTFSPFLSSLLHVQYVESFPPVRDSPREEREPTDGGDDLWQIDPRRPRWLRARGKGPKSDFILIGIH